ncbi:MAG: FkbM family methyltransferase [Chloroflexota bacterium]
MFKKLLLQFAGLMARILPSWVKRAVYDFKPLAGLVRASLNRAVPAGLSAVSVAAGGLKGARLSLDLGAEKDYWLGTYELDLQAAVETWVKPGDVVYDVGANIGYITLLLSRAVGPDGQVFSFEALPTNIERLEKNLGLNAWAAGVTIKHAAVASASSPINFLVGPSGAMGKAEGSAGRSEGHSESLQVAGIALDDFVYRDHHPAPDLIKMDIEGGEVLALAGMPRLLRDAQPIILIELHGHEAARTAWDTLTAADYSIHQMASGYPPVDTLDDLDWKAYLVALPRRSLT